MGSVIPIGFYSTFNHKKPLFMMHPKTELKLISKEIGYGVVAKEFIPAGTITWALDELDREFTPAQFQKMKPLSERFPTF